LTRIVYLKEVQHTKTRFAECGNYRETKVLNLSSKAAKPTNCNLPKYLRNVSREASQPHHYGGKSEATRTQLVPNVVSVSLTSNYHLIIEFPAVEEVAAMI
jgi:hypothetical protein